MRLLNIRTGQLDVYHDIEYAPRYAILSHTWLEQEVTFRDIADNRISGTRLKQKLGYQKLEYLCLQAFKHGLSHVWADVCCIDQTSLTELTEAINSMYSWYAKSTVCYVYLADVTNWMVSSIYTSQTLNSDLPRSRWFKRGWTLQELIAPMNVVFYDKGWNRIGRLDGTMPEFLRVISEITRIDVDILSHRKQLSSVSIAARMSWASDRKTTRPEDIAYSLMGIFDVSMSLVYGEGDKAFYRLQQEIIKKSVDHSIFAWEPLEFTTNTLLATSPKAFRGAHSIICAPTLRMEKSYTLTNAGLEITLPIVPHANGHLCILNCRGRGEPSSFRGLRLLCYGQDVHSNIYSIRGTNRLLNLDLEVGWGQTILYAKQQRITILEDANSGPNHDGLRPQPALTVLCTYDDSEFALVDSFPQLNLRAKSFIHLELPTARGLYGIFVLRSAHLPEGTLLLAFFLISTQHCSNSSSSPLVDEFTALPILIPVAYKDFESTTLSVICDYLCHSYQELRTTLFGITPLAHRAHEGRVTMEDGPTFYARASFIHKLGEYFMHLEVRCDTPDTYPAPYTSVDYLYWVACSLRRARYVIEPIVARKDTHEFHRATHLAHVANHVNSGNLCMKAGRSTHFWGDLCSCAGPDTGRSGRLANMKVMDHGTYLVLEDMSFGADIWSWPDDSTTEEDERSVKT